MFLFLTGAVKYFVGANQWNPAKCSCWLFFRWGPGYVLPFDGLTRLGKFKFCLFFPSRLISRCKIEQNAETLFHRRKLFTTVVFGVTKSVFNETEHYFMFLTRRIHHLYQVYGYHEAQIAGNCTTAVCKKISPGRRTPLWALKRKAFLYRSPHKNPESDSSVRVLACLSRAPPTRRGMIA